MNVKRGAWRVGLLALLVVLSSGCGATAQKSDEADDTPAPGQDIDEDTGVVQDMGTGDDVDMTAAMCGNNTVDTGEACDGTDLAGQSCEGLDGFGGGTLACAADCTFDTSQCNAASTCGDGVIEGAEVCDGNNLGGTTCLDSQFPEPFTSGALQCASDCLSFDTSMCSTAPGALCGNRTIEMGEACDGGNLNGQTCVGLGFDGGSLECTSTCQFNRDACLGNGPMCGDNRAQGNEVCDGNDLQSQTCLTLGENGTGGTFACAAECGGCDTSGCTTGADGATEGDEVCEGTDLGAVTMSAGVPGRVFTGGTLGG